MTTFHDQLTQTTLFTTRQTTDLNYEPAYEELEALRITQLGGRGLIYRRRLNEPRIFDSVSRVWQDGPGYKLTLVEVL